MTALVIMLGLVVAMVAPGIVMRVNFLRTLTREERGEVDAGMLVIYMAVAGFLLVSVALGVVVVHAIGSAHAGELTCGALVFPGMRLLNPYPGGGRYWNVIDVHENTAVIRWEDGTETEGMIDPDDHDGRTGIGSALLRGRIAMYDWYGSPIGPSLPRLGTEHDALRAARARVGGSWEDLAGGFVGLAVGSTLVTVNESAYEVVPDWCVYTAPGMVWLDSPDLYVVGSFDDSDGSIESNGPTVYCGLADLASTVARIRVSYPGPTPSETTTAGGAPRDAAPVFDSNMGVIARARVEAMSGDLGIDIARELIGSDIAPDDGSWSYRVAVDGVFQIHPERPNSESFGAEEALDYARKLRLIYGDSIPVCVHPYAQV